MISKLNSSNAAMLLHNAFSRTQEILPDDWNKAFLLFSQIPKFFQFSKMVTGDSYQGTSLLGISEKISVPFLLMAVRNSRMRLSKDGFRCGCADQPFTLRKVLKLRFECLKKSPTVVYFIDFAAAFNSINPMAFRS